MKTQPLFNPLEHPLIFSSPDWLTDITAWNYHIPFAFLIIDLLQPRRFVELGTHTGVSYCAFCQAVKSLNTGTTCFAVDTWSGDSHAGFYGEDVLETLKAHHDSLYGTFSTLVRSTFDCALSRFEDGSIDLLHIDGLHTYRAVKHDFETWLPKMSERSIILFHDTHVHRDDFGVFQLWDELKELYPSRSFSFGNGLGVLATGQNVPSATLRLFTCADEQWQAVHALFQALGERIDTAKHATRLEAAHERCETQLLQQGRLLAHAQSVVVERDRQLADALGKLEALGESHTHALNIVAERDRQVDELGKILSSQAEAITKLAEDRKALHEQTIRHSEALRQLQVELAMLEKSHVWQVPQRIIHAWLGLLKKK